MDLGGKPVLDRVIQRAVRARGIDEVIVVTTLGIKDLPLVRLCAEQGVRVFTGSEDDVLDRFYQAAKIISPDHIVRITADCPVLDPTIISRVVERHIASGADYTSNTLVERYPDGEDVEVFSFASLQRAWNEATLASEREHVTPFIRNHPDLFRLESVICERDLSDQRWTLDTDRDYDFLSALYRELGAEDEYFGMERILAFLGVRAELRQLNEGIVRNEGLAKSLREDRKILKTE
jgi:spore coat polysaccharide biosynthesis protein SpsF (cytidylyltransferase family)